MTYVVSNLNCNMANTFFDTLFTWAATVNDQVWFAFIPCDCKFTDLSMGNEQRIGISRVN